MRRVPLLLVGIAVASVTLLAQTPASPSFEVASVRANRSGTGFRAMPRGKGEQLTMTNLPLSSIIAFAYQLRPNSDARLVGLPGWTETSRYDIVAKAPAGVMVALPMIAPFQSATLSPGALMLRALLGDRFQLKVHRETRELPTYSLIMARADRTSGKGLRECATLPDPKECGFFTTGLELYSYASGGISMAGIADFLSMMSQRPVIDRTELTGRYDVNLNYQPTLHPGTGESLPTGVAINADGPSLFVALEEQLGLKLEPTKGPVEVLVIDHVERPSEN